jgi:hypothetical protein
MSDIFISYSKADHALALKLSAFLEAEGWTVWWDKSLGAADLYRDEIMKQLAAARAVITIWTENSVKSDWVRAEAGRAKAEGKLIPVKAPEVAYGDIPLPFGEMHTENVASTDLIRAAIVAQLAKPAVQQSAFSQITSTFKYQILTWIGIVGSAITIFANLGGVLNLADWARALVYHWHEWNQIIWGLVFGLIKVKVPREVVPIISFTVFTAILVVGVNLSSRATRAVATPTDKTQVKRKVVVFATGVLLYFVILFVVFFLATVTIFLIWGLEFDTNPIEDSIRIVWALVFPLVYLLFVSKGRLWILMNSLLFFVIGLCLLIVPINEVRFVDWDISPSRGFFWGQRFRSVGWQ